MLDPRRDATHAPSLAINSAVSLPPPPRANALLAGIVRDVAAMLEPVLADTLGKFEKQLFAQADGGLVAEQQSARDAMRQLRRYRADLLPTFLSALQSRVDAAFSGDTTLVAPAPQPAEWSLLDNAVLEESALVDILATRLEQRLHLPLHLLSRRIGVLFRRTPLSLRDFPLGPHALLRILCEASASLDLGAAARTQLFAQFQRCVMPVLASLYARANAALADAGVLPDLQGYDPFAREESAPMDPVDVVKAPTATAPAPPQTSMASAVPANGIAARSPAGFGAPIADAAICGDIRAQAAETGAQASPSRPAPNSGMASSPANVGAGMQDDLFGVMRGLLGGRRALLGKFGAGAGSTAGAVPHPVSGEQLQAVLRGLQRAANDGVGGPSTTATRRPLKSLLMGQLQQSAPPDARVLLPEAQGDTVELLDLLFDQLLKDAPAQRATAPLFAQLQIPLLRVALQDPGFFTRPLHPARRMLDALAEADMYWHADGDEDPEFAGGLLRVVERVADEFDGDMAVFERAGDQVLRQLEARTRKAAIAERRHVDAERGRERLERARLAASDAISSVVGNRALSPFLHSLLHRAWTDVLALSALRGGDGVTLFARQLAVARCLVERATAAQGLSGVASAADLEESEDLREVLSSGLCLVGYQRSDADALAAAAFRMSSVRVDGAGSGRVSVSSRGTAFDAKASGSDRAHATSAMSPLPMTLAPLRVRATQSAHVTASADACNAPATPNSTTEPLRAASSHDSVVEDVEHILARHVQLGASRMDAMLPVSAIHPSAPTPSPDAPLPDVTRRQLDQLRRLPFGTWFDLTDADIDRRRCRMSWFSPVTGRCLFVNHRGQRVGDFTLTWLAHEMEQGRARVVREANTSVVDSAWQAILGMLRSFTPRTAELAVA